MVEFTTYAEAWGVSVSDILSSTRKKGAVGARAMIAHDLQCQGYTPKNIADLLKKDRTSIYFYINKFESENVYNKEFQAIYKSIESSIIDTKASSVEDLETNLIYLLARGIDIMVRDIEQRLKSRGQGFAREKKAIFTDCIKRISQLKHQLDRLDEDIAKACKNAQTFDYAQEDTLELIRLVLLFSDKTAFNPYNAIEIFSLLRSQKGQGLITDKILDKYFLKQ